eukprot:m.1235898 g.1235898  ORF g.1235898 m.1235898 type:complete len:226 (-) comp24665_c0_seq124:1193-1870(-)
MSDALVAAQLQVLGTWYGRRQQQKRKQARFDLEQTELLLSDITEKHDRMQQAWAISEDDLVLDRQLASGTYGTVWAGYWGHIPVAVKRLKIPLDDLDPVSADDFEKEVTSMQSIRHPNLLSFYGAGVTHCGMAFLVVELMARGSMRSLLKDKQKTLPWTLRMSIAVDIARFRLTLRRLYCVCFAPTYLCCAECILIASRRMTCNALMLENCFPCGVYFHPQVVIA